MATAADAMQPRRRRVNPAADTRIRIMEAAEKLFADRGIDAIALREIATAAKQGNTGAVQYHFGSKERLVYEIFEYRTQIFEPLRAEMLLEAERDDRLDDMRTLFEIVCLPHLSIADEDGRHPYSAFLAQYVLRSHLPGMPHPYENPEAHMPALRRVRFLIARRAARIPADMLQLRFQICKLMFLNMLVRRDSGQPIAASVSLDAMVDDTLKQMSAAMLSD